jgi:DNA-binding transcriptional MerR regulator
VLRFWETRFTQIKPMKRSGGRRYYRPDDVDLLRGIRRLLYGEGYTIRGVQRILKEYGIASVQRLADSTAVASFGAVEEAIGRSLSEGGDDAGAEIDVDDDDFEEAPAPRKSREPRRLAARDEDEDEDDFDDGPIPGVTELAHPTMDVERLRSVLDDLIACRQLLDQALKEG